MDFVYPFPLSHNGYDSVLTVVDRLTKMVEFIPTTRTVTAEGVARLFFDHIFRHFGLPQVIISDRDTRFTGKFWTTLTSLVGTHLRFSTAFHPQTDGMAERYNRTLEEMLRSYVTQLRNPTHWDDLLTYLEFAYTASVNAVTGYTPFYLMYGEQPCVSTTMLQPLSSSVGIFPRTVWRALRIARERIQIQLNRHKERIDKRRRHIEFEEGDPVYICTQNLSDTQMPSLPRKLWPKFVGPFVIVNKISSKLYRLQLPPEFKVHPVFNVDQLKPFYAAPVEEEQVLRTSPLTFFLQNLENPPVEAIVDRRGAGVTRQYLVKWKVVPSVSEDRKCVGATAGGS